MSEKDYALLNLGEYKYTYDSYIGKYFLFTHRENTNKGILSSSIMRFQTGHIVFAWYENNDNSCVITRISLGSSAATSKVVSVRLTIIPD